MLCWLHQSDVFLLTVSAAVLMSTYVIVYHSVSEAQYVCVFGTLSQACGQHYLLVRVCLPVWNCTFRSHVSLL